VNNTSRKAPPNNGYGYSEKSHQQFPQLCGDGFDPAEPEREAEEHNPARDQNQRAGDDDDGHDRRRAPRHLSGPGDEDEPGDQIADAGRLRAQAERVHEHRLGPGEQRVEIAVLDEAADVTDAARHGHGKPECRRDDAEQHLDVGQPPATQRGHVLQERPPEHEEGEVVEHHEHDLDDEGAAQGQRRLHIGRDQRARERQVVSHH
jgi:hypothetical protein